MNREPTGQIVEPMSLARLVFHWTMIIWTCGLWWPAYAAAKRKRRLTTYRLS